MASPFSALPLLLLIASLLSVNADVCSPYNGNCNGCVNQGTFNASVTACTYCMESNLCFSLGSAAASSCPTFFQLNMGSNASCPVLGELPPYSTSSNSASGILAMILIVVIPIFMFVDWIRILCSSSQKPVLSRALRDCKMVQVEGKEGVMVSRPENAFIAVSCKGLVRVDLDSTRNKFIRPMSFFLICYIVVGMAPALGMNAFQTAPSSIDTQITMMGIARPDGTINAGMLGLSNINYIDDASHYDATCKYLSGADLRSCYIVAATGGFTLAYAIVIVTSGSLAIFWALLIYCRSYRSAATVPLRFPARFYTLIAFANSGLSGILLLWGLPGSFALGTGALIPHATFFPGTSFLILVVTKVHVAILDFIVWHLVESAWIPEGVQMFNSNESPPMSPISNDRKNEIVPTNIVIEGGNNKPPAALRYSENNFFVSEPRNPYFHKL